MLEYHPWLARYQSCLAGLTTSCYHLGDVGSPPAAKFGQHEISEIVWKAKLNPKSLTHSLTHTIVQFHVIPKLILKLLRNVC